MRHFSKYLTLI